MIRTLYKAAALLALGVVLAGSTASAAEEDDTTADLEARLKAAHERLNEAAREIGELTARMSEPFVQSFHFVNEGSRRAIIGVQLDPESPKGGARVDQVSPGGPAATAGVRAGDVIISVNGTSVEGDRPVREVTRMIAKVEPDSTVKLRVRRGDAVLDFNVVARAAPRAERFAFQVPDPMPPLEALPHVEVLPDWMHGRRGAVSGMELATLTPQLGRYFGTEEGVLVVRAPEDDALKLEDGDVILSIDGRKPTSGSHATRILRSYQAGEQVKMRIMRQRKSMDLAVTLPENTRDRRIRAPRPEERPEERA